MRPQQCWRGAKVSILDLNKEVGTAAAAELGGAFFKVNVADDVQQPPAIGRRPVIPWKYFAFYRFGISTIPR